MNVNLAIVAAFFLICISENETAPPLFLSAITSALATIPFTGGPLSTSLMGAKLAVGTKLLYYLGYFGRRSKPKSASKQKATAAKSGSKSTSGLQSLPPPHTFGGGAFPPMSGGMSGQPGFNLQGSQNFNQYQLFEALRAQGIDANTAMQMVNYGGFGGQGGGFGSFPAQGGSFGQSAIPGQGAPFPHGFPFQGAGGLGNPSFSMQGGFGMNTAMGQGFTSGPGVASPGFDGSSGFPSNSLSNFQSDQMANIESSPKPHSSETELQESNEGSEDIESFFTFMKDMDDNTCISRLVCDIGLDPTFLGDFSENIYSIVGSLDVKPSSGAYPYVKIMQSGKKEGNCAEKFPDCGDAAYEVVKNVAPSVGVPDNIDPASVNRL